jgi:hypothetical protein
MANDTGRTATPIQYIYIPELIMVAKMIQKPRSCFPAAGVIAFVIQIKGFVHKVGRRKGNIRILFFVLANAFISFDIVKVKPDFICII